MSPYNNSLLPSLAVEPKLVMEKQITLNLQRANSTAFSNNDKSPFVYNWNTSDFEQNKEWVKKYSFNYSHRLIWSPEVTNSGKVQWTMFSSCLFFFFLSLISHHLPAILGLHLWKIGKFSATDTIFLMGRWNPWHLQRDFISGRSPPITF